MKNPIRKITAAGMTAVAIQFASAAVPEVTGVTMSQAGDRLVTITYTLSDAPAVVTLDVQTNVTGDVWASIGGEAVWNAMGDVWKRVETGSRTITWHPDHSWPDHKITGNNARAVVTAWALENTPDYMVVDLTGVPDGDKVRYYPGADFLPKKGFDQVGAAVTNNIDYKTTKLLMRKIMARGVEWTMGSATDETQRNASREATHLVTLTNNYYIGVFQVTQKQWELVATNSSVKANFRENGAMRPMESACYNEIRIKANSATDATSDEISNYAWPKPPHPSSFLGLLRSRTGLDFDLPSEAQWEFAARAGNGSGFWGDGSMVMNANTDGNLGKLGRYRGNNPSGDSAASTLRPDQGGTAIVGSYSPNSWGLYDVYGNVAEFCVDLIEDDITSYGGKVNVDPASPGKTLSGKDVSNHVYRGGAWYYNAGDCRAAIRPGGSSSYRAYDRGIRVVCQAGLQ